MFQWLKSFFSQKEPALDTSCTTHHEIVSNPTMVIDISPTSKGEKATLVFRPESSLVRRNAALEEFISAVSAGPNLNTLFPSLKLTGPFYNYPIFSKRNSFEHSGSIIDRTHMYLWLREVLSDDPFGFMTLYRKTNILAIGLNADESKALRKLYSIFATSKNEISNHIVKTIGDAGYVKKDLFEKILQKEKDTPWRVAHGVDVGKETLELTWLENKIFTLAAYYHSPPRGPQARRNSFLPLHLLLTTSKIKNLKVFYDGQSQYKLSAQKGLYLDTSRFSITKDKQKADVIILDHEEKVINNGITLVNNHYKKYVIRPKDYDMKKLFVLWTHMEKTLPVSVISRNNT